MASSETSGAIGRPGTGSEGREEILDAAAQSFMEYGFTGATIDDVADRISATKGRVYHYYRSKVDLFLDVHLRAMNIMIEAVEPLAKGPGTPAERLYAMAHRHACSVMDNFAYQKVSIQGLEKPLISSRGGRADAMIARVVSLRDAYESLFAGVIEEGIADGSFADGPARRMTKPVLGALNWLTLWYRPELSRDREQQEDIADSLARFVVRGCNKGSGDAGGAALS
jgi:AcrR family transcriptional regulator